MSEVAQAHRDYQVGDFVWIAYGGHGKQLAQITGRAPKSGRYKVRKYVASLGGWRRDESVLRHWQRIIGPAAFEGSPPSVP